jgi:triosephosphate isomerase
MPAAAPLLVAGNWKMNGGLEDARRWARAALRAAAEGGNEVAIFPPYPWLLEVAGILEGSPVALGAQACHPEPYGAFTGGVSAAMLREAGCSLVLCGHSERRRLAGETDEVVGACVRRALEAGLVPVLCVGESQAERRAGLARAVVTRQLEAGLGGLRGPSDPLLLAYEPVWAIGTGVVATPTEVADAHGWLRFALEGAALRPSGGVRILYGGSVDPASIEGLLAARDVDGVLVGGASLDPETFRRLVAARRPTATTGTASPSEGSRP